MEEQGDNFDQLYLKLGQVVFGEGSSVCCHRDVVVELSQADLTHFCPVFPQIFLSKVKLNTEIKLKRKNKHKFNNYDTSRLKISNIDQKENMQKNPNICIKLTCKNRCLTFFPLVKELNQAGEASVIFSDILWTEAHKIKQLLDDNNVLKQSPPPL